MNQEQLRKLSKTQLIDYLESRGIPASKRMHIRELIRVANGGQSDAQIKEQIKRELLLGNEDDGFELSPETVERIQVHYTLTADKQAGLTQKKLEKYITLRNQLIRILKKLERITGEYNERDQEGLDMDSIQRIYITRQEMLKTEKKLRKLLIN